MSLIEGILILILIIVVYVATIKLSELLITKTKEVIVRVYNYLIDVAFKLYIKIKKEAKNKIHKEPTHSTKKQLSDKGGSVKSGNHSSKASRIAQKVQILNRQNLNEETERKRKEWLDKKNNESIEVGKTNARKLREEQEKKIQERIQLEKNDNITSKLWDHYDRLNNLQEPTINYETERKTLVSPKQPKKRDYQIQQKISVSERIDNELLFVNYNTPNNFTQSDNWSYAVAKFPENGCVIKPPASAKFEHRGFKEEFFEQFISKHLPSRLNISGQFALPTGENTRPFEPDIAILFKDKTTNLFIDIEIDEPYGGITRSAIHHSNDRDDVRDLYFIHRGWTVIRFAEIQIHTEPLQCAAYIAKIIHEIAPHLSVNSSLLTENNPSSVKRWDRIQAEKWAKEKYREKYLGIDSFKRRDQGEIISSIEDRQIDKEVEARVKYRPPFSEDKKTGVKILEHSKDKRIRFDPIPHQYYIDGVPVKSVTTIVDKHFPFFDANHAASRYLLNRNLPLTDKDSLIAEWNKKGEDARTKGTKLHLLIEKYFSEKTKIIDSELSNELSQFEMFIEDHEHLNPVRTEWRIFDERIRIAGTIDFLSKNSDGTFDIYDWKRSKKLVSEDGLILNNNPYQSGFGQLEIFDDTSYNKYTLQQSIYKYILENSYGIYINQMHLVVLHPKYDVYQKIEVSYWEKPVRYILGYV